MKFANNVVFSGEPGQIVEYVASGAPDPNRAPVCLSVFIKCEHCAGTTVFALSNAAAAPAALKCLHCGAPLPSNLLPLTRGGHAR